MSKVFDTEMKKSLANRIGNLKSSKSRKEIKIPLLLPFLQLRYTGCLVTHTGPEPVHMVLFAETTQVVRKPQVQTFLSG
jgi:hypothetical protein